MDILDGHPWSGSGESRSFVSRRTGRTGAVALVPGARPISLPHVYPLSQSYLARAEAQTRRWFVQHVKPDWHVLDVGANVGVYSILASRLATAGRVVALEPTSTFEMLRKNLRANEANSVEVLRFAAGAASGRKADDIYRIWGEDPEQGEYEFITLDELSKSLKMSRCDLVKIDVDGFEHEVIEGAECMLREFSPTVIVEINHASETRARRPMEILRRMMTLGYSSATVLDHENFVLSRERTPSTNGASGNRRGTALEVDFDRQPVLLAEHVTSGEPLEEVRLLGISRRGRWRWRRRGPITIEAEVPRWSYCGVIRLPAVAGRLPDFVLEVDLEVLEGEVDLCVAGGVLRREVSDEVLIPQGPPGTVRLVCRDSRSAKYLIVRNAARGAARTVVRIVAARVHLPLHTADPEAIPSCGEILNLTQFAAAGSNRLASTKAAVGVRAIDVDRLHTILDIDRPYIPPRMVIPYSLHEWSMSRDDSEVLRWLFRELNPRRHFEFGTWEGAGVTLVGKATDAEIWTVNLPDGERDVEGQPLYPAPSGLPTDAGMSIGWMYRAAGIEERVHQILCDSSDLDLESLPVGSFDTVLIDGGHTEEIVARDTQWAIQLLRPGGIVIWHDFCPVTGVVRRSDSVRGVVAAVARNIDRWEADLKHFYWVNPSHFAIAVRR